MFDEDDEDFSLQGEGGGNAARGDSEVTHPNSLSGRRRRKRRGGRAPRDAQDSRDRYRSEHTRRAADEPLVRVHRPATPEFADRRFLSAPRPEPEIRIQKPGAVNLKDFANEHWRAGLARFMSQWGHTRARDFGRRTGEKTVDNRRFALQGTLQLLEANVPQFRSLNQLRPKHLPTILKLWTSPDSAKAGAPLKSNDTIVTDYSVLCWFWRVCGIPCKPIKEVFDDPAVVAAVGPGHGPHMVRRGAATEDKSWSGKGHDVEQVIAEVRSICKVSARLLELQRTAGLRVKESMCIRPHQADDGIRLSITAGSKGGRPREIFYKDLNQDVVHHVLEGIKDQLSPEEHAAWNGRTLKQNRHRFYWVMRQAGVTKKKRGIVPHGMRHEFTNEVFELLTGQDSPIRGGVSADWSNVLPYRKKLSRLLGHERVGITSAYLGRFVAMSSPNEQRFDASFALLRPLLADLYSLLQQHGVNNLWWVGNRACGANYQLGVRFEFLLDDDVPPDVASKLRPALVDFLEDRLKFVVALHVARASTQGEKEQWASGSIPLFDVDAPRLDGIEGVTWGPDFTRDVRSPR